MTFQPFYRPHIPLNGTFKGRGRDYLSLLTCPLDRAALTLDGGMVRCQSDPAHIYPFEDGILRLVSPGRRANFDTASAAWDEQGAAAGWQSPDEAQFRALPRTGLKGYPDDYWSQQAAATALLWRFLEAIRLEKGGLPIGAMGEAALIGAGMGWLAYGLDVAGYTTLAIDSRAGSRYGLGVFPIARYLRVQADPLDPPLARGAFDWVIFQEGLARPNGDDPVTDTAHHNVARGAVLDHALDALRPGGWLAVIDAVSPSETEAATVNTLLAESGLALVDTPQRSGWRTRMLELRDRLTGRDPGVPPVMVAQKPA